MNEEDLLRILDSYVRIIRAQLEIPNRGITQILSNILGKIITDEEAERYINQINYLYTQMSMSWREFTQISVYGVYNNSASLTMQYLDSITRLDLDKKKFIPDTKTLGRLVRNINDEFTIAVNNGKEYVKSFITFSKQGILTESEIDNAIFKGYLDKGTGRAAKKELLTKFEDRITKEMYNRNPLYRKIKFEQIEGMSVSDAVKMRLKKEFEEKLSNNQYLPIINRNGDIMVFKTKTYSDLVSRTRLGESSVAGTIDAAESRGIEYFRVTKHNTDTLQCRVHEGKIYSSRKGDPKFAALSDYTPYKDEKGRTKQSQNKPLYHINCRHRLLPYTMTNREYEKFPDRAK
jgi:hypothetical protein